MPNILTTKNYYDELTNNNVQFLQGTQAQLNKYLPGSGDALEGTAIEGAFYLTTDTHRLYVGRKVITPQTGTLPSNMTANKIYPEEVSTGIATVKDTGSLPSPGTEAHYGDFYYITDENILAVYENINGTGQWVQINAATEITGFTQNTQAASGLDDTILALTSVTTPAGTKSAQIGLVEGNNNVQLAAGTKTVGTGANAVTVPTIKISTTDTTYTAGTVTSATTNGASIGLKKNGGSSLDSTITITGANDIGITSTANGAVTVSGPDFSGKGVAASALATNGFKFQLQYDSGDSTQGAQTIEHSTASTLDPTITIGATSGYSEPSSTVSMQQSAIHFNNGNATLNVYTKAQADQAITDAINDKLETANAMTYMGTIKSSSNTGVTATAVINTIATQGTGHNGDTYKAACDFTYNTIDVKTGDLVILRGEEVNGVIPTANLTIDIIPSGDEPFIGPSFAGDAVGNYGSTPTQTVLNLVDKKNSDSKVAGLIVPNTDKIKVTSTITNNDTATLNIEHRTLTTTKNDTKALTTTTGSDTIGTNTVSLFVLNSKNGITTDNYGHVSKVEGKQITFKHNTLKSVGVGYSNETLAANSPLLSKAYASVSVTDELNTIKSNSIALESKTLSIASNGAANVADQALSIDIKWGSF